MIFSPVTHFGHHSLVIRGFFICNILCTHELFFWTHFNEMKYVINDIIFISYWYSKLVNGCCFSTAVCIYIAWICSEFLFVNFQYNCLAVGDFSHLFREVNQMHEKKSCINWPWSKYFLLKFIYSEKATKFCEIFTLLLTGTT